MKVFVKGNLLVELKSKLAARDKEIQQEVLSRLVAATPIDTGEAREGWKITERGIENDVEHMSYLNDGHSPQADANFIERTVLSVPGVKPSGTIVRLK
jgi:hypothetical protein